MAPSSRVKRTTDETAPQQPVGVERPAKPPPPRRIPVHGTNAPAVATKAVARSIELTQQRRPSTVGDRLSKAPSARIAVPRPRREEPVLSETSSTQSQGDSPKAAIAPMPILVVSPTSVEQQLTPAAAGSPVHTTDATPSLQPDSQASLAATPAPLPDESHVEHESTLTGLKLPRQPLAVLSSEPAHRDAVGRVPKTSMTRRIVLGSAAALLVVVVSLGLRIFTRKPVLASDQRPLPTASIRSAATQVSIPAEVTVPPHMRLAAVAPATTTASEHSATAQPIVNPDTPAANSPPLQSLNALAGEDAIPDYVSKPALLHLSSIAIRRAQRCHPHGHAVGSARVLVTFAANGRVSDARIEGEPLASAPVSSCILGHAHAIRIAKFKGAPFTYTLPITMR